MGRTEEAFTFYKSVFGGEFAVVMRFSEMQDTSGFPEADKKKIMHMSLPIGNNVLMGTDTLESMGHTLTIGDNTSISVSVDTREEADRVFAGLSEGGKIDQPLQDMFWGDYYGMLVDKFGIQWMVSCRGKNS